MSTVTREMASRVAAWLRSAYPGAPAKSAARAFDASPRTAEKWLAGDLPSNRHLAAMAQKWGRGFVAFVYEPVCGPICDDIDLRLETLEHEFKKLRSDINNARNKDKALPRPGEAQCAPGGTPFAARKNLATPPRPRGDGGAPKIPPTRSPARPKPT